MLNRWLYFCLVLFLAAGNVMALPPPLYKEGDTMNAGTPRHVSVSYSVTSIDYGTPLTTVGWSWATSIASGGEGVVNIWKVGPDADDMIVASVGMVGVGAHSGTGVSVLQVGQELWAQVYYVTDVPGGGSNGTGYTKMVTGSAGPPKQLTFALPANGGVNAINWAVIKNATGEIIVSASQPPGAGAASLTATVAAGALPEDYRLKYWLSGLGFNAGTGQWVTTTVTGGVGSPGEMPSSETVFDANADPQVPANIVPTGTTPTPANSVVVKAPTLLPGAAYTTPGTGGTVWSGASTGAGLTDTAYRQGIDKVVNAINAANGPGKLIAESQLSAYNAGTSAVGESSSKGSAAKTETAAAYGTAPSGLGYTVDGGGAPGMTFTLPASMGGKTIDVNPFGEGRFAGIFAWFRSAVNWLCLVVLGIYCWKHIAEWTRGFSTIRQAQGNAVIGGTGAQATALAAAGAITVAIVIATTALIGWSFGDISLPSLVAKVTTNPMSGLAAGSLWLLDQCFPVATMIASLVARMSFHIFASALFAGVSSVIRFIVP